MGASGSGGESRGDTIAALATAPGRGALAIIRLSGPDAVRIAGRIGAIADPPARPRVARRVTLHACDDATSPLDDAVSTRYAAPRSMTGEDVVELTVHGGPFVSGAVLAALVTAGARPALAGEFTERAVRNGKLDLLQAEAIADLIEARSRAAHRTALRQLSGALSHRLAALRAALIEVEALIAYEIDFPGEDDGPLPRDRATQAADGVLRALDALCATLPVAELGREGVTIVLAGRPNAGKSSLLNALAGAPRAIVSDVPGTTRDAVEVLVEADPWPWRFVDTAGLRESGDAVERLGVEVSTRRLALAHLVLACGEDAAALAATQATIATLTTAPQLGVRTKSDLGQGPEDDGTLAVSARTGAGLDALRTAITHAVRAIAPDPLEESPVVTRARHVTALAAARDEVARFREAWAADVLPGPVAATHLRAAIHALDELHGGIDVDEVFDRVFRAFCIGK